MTAAEAQAFKRACTCFGLGRYLYNFGEMWVRLNEHRQPTEYPTLPKWALPGAKTIGLDIKLPAEQNPNPYITPALNFEFRYFFMRKFWFAYLAKALVVFPGGFGTMDEMFEILTLAQTRKLSTEIPILLYGSPYWKRVLDFAYLREEGAIADQDLSSLLRFADTPEDAFAQLSTALEHQLEAAQANPAQHQPPPDPAPSAQEVLSPDIARTRP